MIENQLEQANNMKIDKINIIIADDEIKTCEEIKNLLENYSYINVLGIANTDEEEVRLIEELKPDVVVTDLMRNHQFTGLDIIKKYSEIKNSPKFVIVSFSPENELCYRYKNIADCVHKFPRINGAELSYKILCAKRIILKEQQEKLEQQEEKQNNFLKRLKMKLFK